MLPAPPFLLFDDARPGGAAARLYRDPVSLHVARRIAEVPAVIAAVRAGLAAGRHAAGYLAYEAGAAFEAALPIREDGTPLAWFGLFDGAEPVADVAALLPDSAGAWCAPPAPAIDLAEYRDRFERIAALIAGGDIYQANLTFRATVRIHGDPFALYARLRRAAAAGWGAAIATAEATFLSLSPELLFTLDDGALACRPMKGTAARLADPVADADAADALAADPKQRAENLMIVDLIRNDLSRVAAPGSVAVPELFAVERYPTVHQMVSAVTARLAPGCDALDVLAALFPCGSITGAPKVRAAQVLDAIERAPRGLYTGSIGWIAPDGDARFNVAIRTLAIAAGSDSATIGLGGGIVADSQADAEWAEALAKGAFLTHDQRGFDLIETMTFDPVEGIALLERHLARMRASALAFGFAFDRHAARNELQAATFRLRAPARIRLLAAASGAIAIEVGPSPAPLPVPLAVALVPLPVAAADVRLRHKTTDRRFYDAARLAACADEVLFHDADGRLTEGSFTNVFVPRDGRLVTPPASRGLLPGVLRAALLEDGRAVEGDLVADDLAGGFFMGNALRGLMPAVVSVAVPRSRSL